MLLVTHDVEVFEEEVYGLLEECDLVEEVDSFVEEVDDKGVAHELAEGTLYA